MSTDDTKQAQATRRARKPAIDRSAWQVGVPHSDPAATAVGKLRELGVSVPGSAPGETAGSEREPPSPEIPAVLAPSSVHHTERVDTTRNPNVVAEVPISLKEAGRKSRLGRSPTQCWIATDRRRALRIYAARVERPVDDLINEAIDDLFIKLKIPSA